MSNEFGGGNAKSLYIPISEIEMEFISRLIESKDIFILAHGWGQIDNPLPSFGDKNLHLAFQIDFTKPEAPTPLYYLDLELKTRSGISLFRQKMATLYGGQPIQVCQGVSLSMVWDISLKFIDPKLIKTLMPKAIGLTSRLEDTATREMTLLGNMKLTKDLRDKALKLHQNEQKLKAMDNEKLKRVPQ